MSTTTRLIPTVENPDLVSCKILVDNTEVENKYQLVNVSVQLEINKIPTANLIFLDGEASEEDFKISDSGGFLPGKKIEINFGYHNKVETVFKGTIISNTHKINESCAEINIECKDETFKMTITKGSRQFSDKTDSEIAQQLLDANQITDRKVDPSSVKHEQLVQSNMPDWDYMISRIDVVGMICVINNSHIDIIKPKLEDDPSLHLTYGANILDFHADMDARVQTASVKTLTWDFSTQSVRETTNNATGVVEEGSIPTSQLASVNQQNFTMRTPAPMTQDEQQALTDTKKLKQELSKIKGKVKYQGVTNVLPGKFINLEGVGDSFNGKAIVSAIHHEYSEGDWTTEATLGWNEQLFSEQISPHQDASSTGQTATMQGLQSAVVTEITDSTGEYRVKVKLPLLDDSAEGIYARVATLDAGDNRGTFFRPEVKDEVIVGFINNDARCPVILGMMHSSAKASPMQPETANNEKGYVSRSGIKLTFDDGQKILKIETPDSRVFEMNDTSGSITLKDSSGNRIVMEQSGITIEAAADLTLTAGASMSISAQQLSIKAAGSAAIESGTMALKGSGTVEMSGALIKIN